MSVLNMQNLANTALAFATASQAGDRALSTSTSQFEVATGGAADTSPAVVEQPGTAHVRESGSQWQGVPCNALWGP